MIHLYPEMELKLSYFTRFVGIKLHRQKADASTVKTI